MPDKRVGEMAAWAKSVIPYRENDVKKVFVDGKTYRLPNPYAKIELMSVSLASSLPSGVRNLSGLKARGSGYLFSSFSMALISEKVQGIAEHQLLLRLKPQKERTICFR